jgi:hypothetical protein
MAYKLLFVKLHFVKERGPFHRWYLLTQSMSPAFCQYEQPLLHGGIEESRSGSSPSGRRAAFERLHTHGMRDKMEAVRTWEEERVITVERTKRGNKRHASWRRRGRGNHL